MAEDGLFGRFFLQDPLRKLLDVLPDEGSGLTALPAPKAGWKALCPVGAIPARGCPYPAEGTVNPEGWGVRRILSPKEGGACPTGAGG